MRGFIIKAFVCTKINISHFAIWWLLGKSKETSCARKRRNFYFLSVRKSVRTKQSERQREKERNTEKCLKLDGGLGRFENEAPARFFSLSPPNSLVSRVLNIFTVR